MKKALLLLLLLLPPPAGAAGRAVWVWEKETYALLEDRRAAADAIAFLKSKGVTRLYLYADAWQGRNLIADKPRLYRRLLRRLRGEGMDAYALLGSYYLRTERYVLPERRAEAEAMLKRVLDYNARAGRAERFSGVNLDIEPHMLPEWKTDRERLLLGFLDLGRRLMDLKRASGQRLAVGPAVPFWLDGIRLDWGGAVKPASEHAADVYDYLALMDYRNRAEGPDGMIAHAAAELKYAATVGRVVEIGVETGNSEPEKVTFYRLRETDFERELGLAEKAFAREPAFSGFVIHHFRTYREFVERSGGQD